MLVELDVSVIGLSIDSVSRQPLPSTRSHGSVPSLHRYYELLGLPVAHRVYVGPTAPRPRFVSFARRYRLSAGTTGSPRFLGNPRMLAAFYDPGRSVNQAFRRCPTFRLAVVASASGRALAPAKKNFEAPSRGLHACCLRFAARVALCRHARLASGWWPSLAGWDLNPLGSIMKFQPCLSTCHPPHPSFAWRTPEFFCKRSGLGGLGV